MAEPLVSLLLCTVRRNPYSDHPDMDAIGKHVQDLCVQVDAPPFELVVVDGLLHSVRPDLELILREVVAQLDPAKLAPFAIRHVPPRDGSPWVRMRKVAICAYRNTGIAAARGELIVNLDDTSALPPNFVATIWKAWHEHRTALAMTWPERGDSRRPGPVTSRGMVYGYGSYPRELALQLNGYDEAYDGGQGLEDADWSTRLFQAGLKQALIHLPGFDILPQVGHAPEAIDAARPIVKCCNQAWQSVRVQRNIQVANLAQNWLRPELERLVGPCPYLHGELCGHHYYQQRCAYLEAGFATALDPEAAAVFGEPPVLDLRRLAEEMQ